MTNHPQAGESTFDHGVGRFNHAMDLTADGELLALGGSKGFFKGGWTVWHRRKRAVVATSEMEAGNTHCLSISRDKKLIAAGGNGGELRLFDLESSKEVATLRYPDRVVNAVQFHSDGKRLFSLDSSGVITVWDVIKQASIQKIHVCRENVQVLDEAIPVRVQTRYSQANVGISRSGELVAIGNNTVIVVIGLKGFGQRSIKLKNTRQAWSFAFSPDETEIAIGDAVGENGEGAGIEIVDLKTGNSRTMKGLHAHSVGCLRFSDDGKYLVSGGVADGVRVWDVKERKLLHRIFGEGENNIFDVRFLPNSHIAAIGEECRPITFWDCATGKRVP